MTAEEKIICIIECLGKKSDWESLLETFFLWKISSSTHSQKQRRLVIQLHHITSQTTMQDCMMQPTSTSWYKEAWTVCPPKNGKLCVKVRQIDHRKRLCTLWHVKYCAKTGAALFC